MVGIILKLWATKTPQPVPLEWPRHTNVHFKRLNLWNGDLKIPNWKASGSKETILLGQRTPLLPRASTKIPQAMPKEDALPTDSINLKACYIRHVQPLVHASSKSTNKLDPNLPSCSPTTNEPIPPQLSKYSWRKTNQWLEKEQETCNMNQKPLNSVNMLCGRNSVAKQNLSRHQTL